MGAQIRFPGGAFGENNEDLPLEAFITHRLSRLQNQLNLQAKELLSKHTDLTVTQWRIVSVLGNKGEMSLQDVQEETQFGGAQIARTVKSLIDMDVAEVRVVKGATDVHLMRLTRRGHREYTRLLPLIALRQQNLLKDFSIADRQTLYALLDRLTAASEKENYS